MDNTTSNLVALMSSSKALLQPIEENIIDMTRAIDDFEAKIKSLKEELAKAKSQFESQETTFGCLDHFKQSSMTNLEELYQAEQNFYIQVSEAR